jgi:hypothetical protein
MLLPAMIHPLLPRGNHHVFPLQVLRGDEQRNLIRRRHPTLVRSLSIILTLLVLYSRDVSAEGAVYTACILHRPDLDRQIVRS